MKTFNADNKIFLNPGELVVTTSNEIIWTLLGSCVSIILHCPKKKVSGICHAQLPSDNSNLTCKTTCPKPCKKGEHEQFRYVTCSFKYMLETFHNKGITNSEITVSLFGGATMYNFDNDIFKVGDMNIRKAKELIRHNKLKIINEDTGGTLSRSLTYYTETGKIDLKYR